MEPPIGSNRPYLASSVTEKTLVANSEARLHTILATLEECRAGLIAGGSGETAGLVSVAILELRMKLHRIGDSELKALCDEMVSDEEARTERTRDSKPSLAQRRRPLLRVVK